MLTTLSSCLWWRSRPRRNYSWFFVVDALMCFGLFKPVISAHVRLDLNEILFITDSIGTLPSFTEVMGSSSDSAPWFLAPLTVTRRINLSAADRWQCFGKGLLLNEDCYIVIYIYASLTQLKWFLTSPCYKWQRWKNSLWLLSDEDKLHVNVCHSMD